MAESVHDLSEADIQKRLADARQDLFMLRLQRTSGKLSNPAKIAETRRSVARMLTELRARGVAASEPVAAAVATRNAPRAPRRPRGRPARDGTPRPARRRGGRR